MSENTPHYIDIRKGDTGVTLGGIFYQNGKQYSLSGKTVKFGMVNAAGTVVVAETATGVTAEPTFTVTLDNTNNWIACNEHPFENGMQGVFATAGSLSGTGLTAAVRYFVVEAEENIFKVALKRTGTPITIAATGTGAHTFAIVGSVQYTWASATPVSTLGDFPYEFRSFTGSASTSFPSDQSVKNPKAVVRITEGLGT